jgi:hypothetical protein
MARAAELCHPAGVTRHQSHRGAAPKDAKLFGPRQVPALNAATGDLCWLLDRGYAVRSSVELVGNRYNLSARQRIAVSRCACSGSAAKRRQEIQVDPSAMAGRELWLDGYNVVTVLESALAGGIILLGRDGCCRDVAGIHRRYRKVDETTPVLRMIGETTAQWGIPCVRWWLDKPVSNSGRLKSLICDMAASAGWNATAELVFNPDRTLWESGQVVATSDSVILDRCRLWLNLTRHIIFARVPNARIVDLSTPGDGVKSDRGLPQP